MNTTEKIMKTTFTKDVANNKMFITQRVRRNRRRCMESLDRPEIIGSMVGAKAMES